MSNRQVTNSMSAPVVRITPGLVTLALLAGFLAIPYGFGHWARDPSTPGAGCNDDYSTHLMWKNRLRSAWDLEADGGFELAEKEYGSALASNSDCIRVAAIAQLKRISEKRDELGPAYRSLAELANISAQLRAPIVAVAFVMIVCWVVSRLIPRRGTRIGEFPVYGSQRRAVQSTFS
jgi:hypothetical protein